MFLLFYCLRYIWSRFFLNSSLHKLRDESRSLAHQWETMFQFLKCPRNVVSINLSPPYSFPLWTLTQDSTVLSFPHPYPYPGLYLITEPWPRKSDQWFQMVTKLSKICISLNGSHISFPDFLYCKLNYLAFHL